MTGRRYSLEHARAPSWFLKHEGQRPRWLGGVLGGLSARFATGPGRRRWILRGAIIAVVLVFLLPYYRADNSPTASRPKSGVSSSTKWGRPGADDVLQYIDPLIGTLGKGHVFPGATLPFGMVKAGPDVTGQKFAGFSLDGTPISGFSHLHDSGVESTPSLGNFPIFVYPSCPNGQTTDCQIRKTSRATGYVDDSVTASPGYFSVHLSSGVQAEMTTSQRAALYQFSFPNTGEINPLILMDASDLSLTPGRRKLQIEQDKFRITGDGLFLPSYGQGTYKAYVCADVRIRTASGILENPSIFEVGTFDETHKVGKLTVEGKGATSPQIAAFLRLNSLAPGSKVLVRVGVSWLGVQKACDNAGQIDDWDFDRVVKDARHIWQSKLSAITVRPEGKVSKSLLRTFWSGVYRSFISPQDYSDENQLGWEGDEPYYDSFYCMRDTSRGVHPLITLVDPQSQVRMVRSLLETFKREGWLPECRMAFCKGYVQGGSSADTVLVDSYLKLGKASGIDWSLAYDAVMQNAENQSESWNVQGRGALNYWKEKGFIPYKANVAGGYNTRSVSRTLEYAYNDFLTASMALLRRKLDVYVKYRTRASNWKNTFKPDVRSLDIEGPFPQPRYVNGVWQDQDPTSCSPLSRADECSSLPRSLDTWKGSPWMYSFHAPGDMAALIELMGGKEAFLERLDKLHDSGVLDISNSMAFLTPFLYHYAGRPARSTNRTHTYIPRLYSDKTNGVPGNDGGGNSGAFVAFSMMGIIPVAGQNVYLLSTPFFPSVSFKNQENGNVSTINVKKFDSTYRRKYIQSAKLDGAPYTKSWIDHTFFATEHTLELTVGEKESDWGGAEKDLPPSLSTTGVHLSEIP